MKNIFSEGWEERYETKFMQYNNCTFQAYVCSPLGAESVESVQRNMHTARAYMAYALEIMHCGVVAPHAYLPILLCDDNPQKRGYAMQIGVYMLCGCNTMLVCGNKISQGMKEEIKLAAQLGMPIHTYNKTVYEETVQIVKEEGKSPNIVCLELQYPPLGSPCPVTCSMQVRQGVYARGSINAVSV